MDEKNYLNTRWDVIQKEVLFLRLNVIAFVNVNINKRTLF